MEMSHYDGRADEESEGSPLARMEGVSQAMNDATRNLVWQGQLDIVRHTRYYGALEQKYRQKHKWVRYTLGVAAVITALPLIPVVPGTVASVAGLCVVGLVVWDLVHDYGRTVAALRVAVEGLSELADRHRSLWDEVNDDSLTEQEARERTETLRVASLNLLRGLDVEVDAALNEQCQSEAFESEKQRYAAG